MNICPKDAISIDTAPDGKTIPIINYDKCVNCGLCKKSCPVNNTVPGIYPNKCFVAQWKSESRGASASGGVATAISQYALENGIHIFGSIFEDGLNLVIRELTSMEEVYGAAGSKYLQSCTGNIFRCVKAYLQNDEKVIFIGTPCQIAGLIRFLDRRYENLVTIDIICHGTPPAKYFKEYVHQIKKRNASLATFRGEKDYFLCLYEGQRLIYKKWHKRDYYFQAYDEGMINRDNCYDCKYANSKRISDITIGDFWGLRRTTLKTRFLGKVSVVLINSRYGDAFWNKISDLFLFEERDIEEAVKGNPHLKKCNPADANYNIFIKNYEKYGFLKSVKMTGIRKRMIIQWIRQIKKTICRKYKDNV
jgi:coenzyme F420-reducing hydrogenase beta subunit